MERKKYLYNPKTLSFDEVNIHWKDRLLKGFGFFAAVIFSAVILLFIISDYITTPKEKLLQEKLNSVNNNLEAISFDLTNLTQEVDKIQDRDANVHRVILGIDPMDQTFWNSGVGGAKNYPSFINSSITTGLLKESINKVNQLKRKVELQNSSLDTLERLALTRANKLASVPSIKPVREDKLNRRISYLSGFGFRDHPIFHIKRFHKGIDFSAPKGTSIQATGNGVVVKAGQERGYGNVVEISHGYGYKTLYGHMSKINVRVGQTIKRGQVIGLIGSTGSSTAPHCHYEVLYNGRNINPIDFVFDGMTPQEYQHFVEVSSIENQSLD